MNRNDIHSNISHSLTTAGWNERQAAEVATTLMRFVQVYDVCLSEPNGGRLFDVNITLRHDGHVEIQVAVGGSQSLSELQLN